MASSALPTSFVRLAVPPANRRAKGFREAVVPERVPIVSPPPAGKILCRVIYAGINASDINFVRGGYESLPSRRNPYPSGTENTRPPKVLYPGFEFCGIVESLGDGDSNSGFRVGSAVVGMAEGCFAEYVVAECRACFAVPEPTAEAVCLPLSGVTAYCGLLTVGEAQPGDTVLVTAAAGGTGSIAVQLAAARGCRVLGTVGSEEKVAFLRSIGCDRPINRKTEDLFAVLRAECPRGVDVCYESVGGKTFDTCVSNLAVGGRLVVIGAISGYLDGSAWSSSVEKASVPLPSKLLSKSASVRGMMLMHFTRVVPEAMAHMTQMLESGKLQLQTHVLEKSVADIPDAVEFLHSGENIGKLIVKIIPDKQTPAARL